MIKKIPVYIALFWLFVVLDSFLIWNPLGGVIKLLAYSGVIVVTYWYAISKQLSLSNKSILAFLCIGLLFLWILSKFDGNINAYILLPLLWLSLLCIMLWPIEEYEKLYVFFRKGIIFFAIGSTFVSLFTVTGLIRFVPYFEIGPRSPLHEELGIVYHVYFFFVTNFGPMEFFPRACGMLQEPGHFAIILGFTYMMDRLLERKVSIWIIICGILTFSSNFPIIVVITEMYNLMKVRNLIKVFKGIILAIICSLVVYNFLSKDMQETVKYLAYERNLEEVVDAITTSGSLQEGLDKRTSSSGDVAFRNIDASNMWTGLGHDDTVITLSDYRGVILQYGLIGLILIILAIFSVTRLFPVKEKIQVILFLFLILLHRSWMFYAPYLYFLPFLLSRLYCQQQELIAQTQADENPEVSLIV